MWSSFTPGRGAEDTVMADRRLPSEVRGVRGPKYGSMVVTGPERQFRNLLFRSSESYFGVGEGGWVSGLEGVVDPEFPSCDITA